MDKIKITTSLVNNIIKKYGGYPALGEYIEKTTSFLKQLDSDSCEKLFKQLEQDNTSSSSTPELLFLSIGHYQAINGLEVYSEKNVGAKIINDFKERLEVFRRIVNAAARCNNVIRHEIIGHTRLIEQTRKNVWNACFGQDLEFAYKYQNVIKDTNVIIYGPTGAGKELIAKAIQMSIFWRDDKKETKKDEILHSINISAITPTLIAGELFGWKKGAHSTAVEDRDGLIKTAHKSVLFLDEIGDFAHELQPKILRAMEEKKIRPEGADKDEEADVRFVSATNKVLSPENIRLDLLQRLSGYEIHLPPLKDRVGDIMSIKDKILDDYQVDKTEIKNQIERFLNALIEKKYDWPGNVRELKSAIRGAILGLYDENNYIKKSHAVVMPVGGRLSEIPEELLQLKWTRKQVDNWYGKQVLTSTNGNIDKAAKILDVARNTVEANYRKI